MSGDERPPSRALFTDLYELTMAEAYVREGLTANAVFEVHFRHLPENRGYVIAAGIDDVLDILEDFRFSEDELAYLESLDMFDDGFLDHLRDLRFSGNVRAVRDGTPVFGYEPILQIEAPVVEAQILETRILNRIHFQCIAATKAARIVDAADGRDVVDFGARRAHGLDAANDVARLSYLCGAAGTSNLEAGRRWGIPVLGTMAHSFIQAAPSEMQAFRTFARNWPGTTLLVDTFDTLRGVDRVIELIRDESVSVDAIRLDSGDLGELARGARKRLDEAQLEDIRIFASSGLDEYAIHDLVTDGAPIDGFGVGTRLVTSEDAPTLDMVYKLVAYGDEPQTKLSEGKVLLPGRKQLWRTFVDGEMTEDVVAAEGHPPEEARDDRARFDGAGATGGSGIDSSGAGREVCPLLEIAMEDGRRIRPSPWDGSSSKSEVAAAERESFLELRAGLPERLRAPQPEEPAYPVLFHDRLEERLEETRSRLEAKAEQD